MCAVTIAKLKEAIPILDVRDVDRALRFYVERLGFQVDFRYAEAPDNYAGVRRDEVCLHMQWREGIHFDQGTAGRLRIRIPVDDPDSLFQEFAAKGVLNETVRVSNTPWGTREFGFRDPDGNGLIFYRELSDSEHPPAQRRTAHNRTRQVAMPHEDHDRVDLAQLRPLLGAFTEGTLKRVETDPQYADRLVGTWLKYMADAMQHYGQNQLHEDTIAVLLLRALFHLFLQETETFDGQ